MDPRTLNIDPEAARAAVGESTAGILPVDIFGYPAAMPALEALAAERGLGLLEDACQALGAVDSEGVRAGARGNAAAFAFYANKQLTTGEGGMLVPPDLRGRGVAAQRAKPGALGRHGRRRARAAGLQLPAHRDLRRRSASPSSSASTSCSRRAPGWPRTPSTRALGAPAGESTGGSSLPCPDEGDERRSWFVYVVQLPEDADRDAVIAALGRTGDRGKAYLPCIHLLPFYRERFGFERGEFPVAERAAERSLALPFFTAMSEGEVERVVVGARVEPSAGLHRPSGPVAG